MGRGYFLGDWSVVVDETNIGGLLQKCRMCCILDAAHTTFMKKAVAIHVYGSSSSDNQTPPSDMSPLCALFDYWVEYSRRVPIIDSDR